jgi:hypothetical protein
MQSKSLLLKAAVTSGVLALLGAGAAFAATSAVRVAAADAPIVAITDDKQLNELVDANDIDHGAKDDVDDHEMNDIDEHAKNDVDMDVKESAADAKEAQQDAVEAKMEHEDEPGGDSPTG